MSKQLSCKLSHYGKNLAFSSIIKRQEITCLHYERLVVLFCPHSCLNLIHTLLSHIFTRDIICFRCCNAAHKKFLPQNYLQCSAFHLVKTFFLPPAITHNTHCYFSFLTLVVVVVVSSEMRKRKLEYCRNNNSTYNLSLNLIAFPSSYSLLLLLLLLLVLLSIKNNI